MRGGRGRRIEGEKREREIEKERNKGKRDRK